MKTKTTHSKRKSASRRRYSEVYVGIDLHSATSVLGVMKTDGSWLGDKRFPTNGRHLVAHLMDVPARRKHVVIEECPMAQWVIGLLRPHCTSILACDPKHNRLISRNAQKRDEIDVQNLCRLYRLGELREVYHTQDDARFAFKAAVQYYHDLQKDRTRAMCKIKAIYQRLGLLFTGERVYNHRHRDEFIGQVADPVWRSCIQRAYKRYDLLHTEAREALKEVGQLGQAYPEIAEFKKIPGIGPVGSHTFDAIIMTPHRFATKSKLFRYSRLSITDRSSDNKPLGYRRLERHGSPLLKSLSYRAWLAATSAREDNEVKDYYHAALEYNGGDKTHARLTTQRKILAVMWSLWKHNRQYDPEQFITAAMD